MTVQSHNISESVLENPLQDRYVEINQCCRMDRDGALVLVEVPTLSKSYCWENECLRVVCYLLSKEA